MEESKQNKGYKYQGEFISVSIPSFEENGPKGLEFCDFENSKEFPSISLPRIKIIQTLKPPKEDETASNTKKNIESMKKQTLSNRDLAEILINTVRRLELKSMTTGKGEGFPLHEPSLFDPIIDEEEQKDTKN